MSKRTKTRRDMPMYAEWGSIELSKGHFRHICKGRIPRWAQETGSDTIRVAQTKDGRYWGEWRGSAVFWANRWYELPKTVGDRAVKIDKFVRGL